MQEAGYLLEDITAELSKYTKRQEKEIKAAMEDAGIKALEYDHKIYEAAGLSPMPDTIPGAYPADGAELSGNAGGMEKLH